MYNKLSSFSNIIISKNKLHIISYKIRIIYIMLRHFLLMLITEDYNIIVDKIFYEFNLIYKNTERPLKFKLKIINIQ